MERDAAGGIALNGPTKSQTVVAANRVRLYDRGWQGREFAVAHERCNSRECASGRRSAGHQRIESMQCHHGRSQRCLRCALVSRAILRSRSTSKLKSRRIIELRPMYITDLTHFLDKSGAIGPIKGPAQAMAQFLVNVITHAPYATGDTLAAPTCFKCKKIAVEAVRAQDDAIVWTCPACRTEGRISNWKGSLWDLRDRPQARSS